MPPQQLDVVSIIIGHQDGVVVDADVPVEAAEKMGGKMIGFPTLIGFSEALAQLVSEGFLSLSPNRGFYVRPLDIEEVGGLLPILSTLEDLALRTVPPVDAEQAATLRELNRQLLESVKHSAVRAMLINQQWHAGLMERCGNRELQRVIGQLRARTFRYEYVYYKFQQDDVEEQARQHEEILTALERGDRRLAREVMSKHWDHDLQLMVPSGHENEG